MKHLAMAAATVLAGAGFTYLLIGFMMEGFMGASVIEHPRLHRASEILLAPGFFFFDHGTLAPVIADGILYTAIIYIALLLLLHRRKYPN